MNNSVRATYIACMHIGQLIMLAMAVAIPVWVTPGHYWWTAFLIFIFMGDGYMIGRRMDKWEGKL